MRIRSVDELRWTDALKIGFAQAFALIPGTSRSGATIIGGMLFGLSRQAATEFSFFLAIPTLFAATGYDFVKNRHLLPTGDLSMIGVGFAVAFVSAFFTIRALLRYVAHHDFVPFAWYRIAFGLRDPRHRVRRAGALGLAGFRRGGGADLVGPAFAIVGVLGFAFKAILIKLAYASTPIDAVTLLTLRMIYSAPFFALMAWWATARTPGAKPLARRDWLSIAWLGFIGYYLSSLVDFMGLQYVTAALERLMLYLYPTIVVVLSAIFFKQRITGRIVVALVAVVRRNPAGVRARSRCRRRSCRALARRRAGVRELVPLRLLSGRRRTGDRAARAACASSRWRC